VDVFVELMGGHDGPAKDATIAALQLGKDVVTAKKAMLAHYGQDLADLAETNGCVLRFEAAVAGGIPIIKSLTEGLAANQVTRVMGVMNGTCNYILTRMQSAGLPYDTVFQEAADLGYLEADPTLDVGGIDAGHKLALLSSIAFGTQVNFDGVELQGIENISIDDIVRPLTWAIASNYLGVAQMTAEGLEQRMSPVWSPPIPLGPIRRRHKHGCRRRRRSGPSCPAWRRRRRRTNRQRGDVRCFGYRAGHTDHHIWSTRQQPKTCTGCHFKNRMPLLHSLGTAGHTGRLGQGGNSAWAKTIFQSNGCANMTTMAKMHLF
jgi:hypothetical protein